MLNDPLIDFMDIDFLFLSDNKNKRYYLNEVF